MKQPPKKRYLRSEVAADLGGKIVFIGGPRQVGKTTLALSFLENGSRKHPAYLNWDVPESRVRILKHELPFGEPLICLDEVHKFKRWRQLLKGFYDRYAPDAKLIVVGSARLDYYRKGGDALTGRYFYFRLHPFSYSEIDPRGGRPLAEQLYRLGGFPEPFFRGSEKYWARWNRARIEQVLSEDLRDLERVHEISLLDLVVESLPERIGSPLSLNAVGGLVGAGAQSIDRWIKILERLYFCYRLPPYGEGRIRAVRKAQKAYFWDWAFAPEGGARFENMTAGHLLKYCHFKEDTEGAKMELRYLRDETGREVDFVVLKNKKPLFAVECKLGDRTLSPAIEYFCSRTSIPKFYQIHMGTEDYLAGDRRIRVLPFWKFCVEEGLS